MSCGCGRFWEPTASLRVLYGPKPPTHVRSRRGILVTRPPPTSIPPLPNNTHEFLVGAGSDPNGLPPQSPLPPRNASCATLLARTFFAQLFQTTNNESTIQQYTRVNQSSRAWHGTVVQTVSIALLPLTVCLLYLSTSGSSLVGNTVELNG